MLCGEDGGSLCTTAAITAGCAPDASDMVVMAQAGSSSPFLVLPTILNFSHLGRGTITWEQSSGCQVTFPLLRSLAYRLSACLSVCLHGSAILPPCTECQDYTTSDSKCICRSRLCHTSRYSICCQPATSPGGKCHF